MRTKLRALSDALTRELTREPLDLCTVNEIIVQMQRAVDETVNARVRAEIESTRQKLQDAGVI